MVGVVEETRAAGQTHAGRVRGGEEGQGGFRKAQTRRGSLDAYRVIAFLTWLWITNVALLFGAEFNAELQRSQQREAGERAPLDEPFLEPRDTTKLEKRPKSSLWIRRSD